MDYKKIKGILEEEFEQLHNLMIEFSKKEGDHNKEIIILSKLIDRKVRLLMELEREENFRKLLKMETKK